MYEYRSRNDWAGRVPGVGSLVICEVSNYRNAPECEDHIPTASRTYFSTALSHLVHALAVQQATLEPV